MSFNPLGNLSPGTYSLSRFGENADVAFAFDGNGSAANQTSGTLVLNELVFDDSLERLDRLSLDFVQIEEGLTCLLYTSPSPRDLSTSRMPSSA